VASVSSVRGRSSHDSDTESRHESAAITPGAKTSRHLERSHRQQPHSIATARGFVRSSCGPHRRACSLDSTTNDWPQNAETGGEMRVTRRVTSSLDSNLTVPSRMGSRPQQRHQTTAVGRGRLPALDDSRQLIRLHQTHGNDTATATPDGTGYETATSRSQKSPCSKSLVRATKLRLPATREGLRPPGDTP